MEEDETFICDQCGQPWAVDDHGWFFCPTCENQYMNDHPPPIHGED